MGGVPDVCISVHSLCLPKTEERQVPLERPGDNLVMVTKEINPYSAGLRFQDLCCLDVDARACHWLSPQV